MSGKDYWGSDIRQVKEVNNYVECQKHCQDMDDCAYWTYDKNGRSCYLKTAAARNDLRKNAALTTGPKYY